MELTVVDILNNTETKMKFGDIMKRYGLSFEETKYFCKTQCLINKRYYIKDGMTREPIPYDDQWIRR